MQTEKGGWLGIKDVEAFNLALMSKWRWHILTDKEVVWKGILLHRYGNLDHSMIGGGVSRVSNVDFLWWRDLIILGSDVAAGKNWFHDGTA